MLWRGVLSFPRSNVTAIKLSDNKRILKTIMIKKSKPWNRFENTLKMTTSKIAIGKQQKTLRGFVACRLGC
jgi:hypothetical protein